MLKTGDRVPYDAFRYLNADRAVLYRAIMAAFMEQKQRFAIHLKPEDILVALREMPLDSNGFPLELTAVEAALTQLREWGNLKAHADNAEYRTLQDFKRAHLLYQLSAEGEAAEKALVVYRETIEAPGELQSAALDDIRVTLAGLTGLLKQPSRDLQKVYAACQSLYARFEGLAARAQQFMGSVQRAIDLQDGDVQAFLAYKERLIEYLDRFIGELITKSPGIAAEIANAEAAGMADALEALARRDAADLLDAQADNAHARIRRMWIMRWEGLRAWFFGQNGEPSQSERLRGRARSAIPDLLAVVADLNARRVQRSDRTADYRSLAHWFAECETDEEMHRLWRSAFCLCPSRHLMLDAASMDRRGEAPVPARTSWLEAEPLWISPHLRRTGKVRRYGRQPEIVDDDDAQRVLARRLAEEARQFREARRQIATGEVTHLADFAELERGALDLFLDCLGAALAAQNTPGQAVETFSSDGSLRVRLDPVPQGEWVTLRTCDGRLHGRDCLISIDEAFADTGVADTGSVA